MSEFSKPGIDEWQSLAARELKNDSVDSLTWKTPEGIDVKPLYSAADLEGFSHLDTMPGFAPYVRGPRATMYAGRPWTVRQVRGVLYRGRVKRLLSKKIWRRDRPGFRSLSIWPPIEVTTPIIPG